MNLPLHQFEFAQLESDDFKLIEGSPVTIKLFEDYLEYSAWSRNKSKLPEEDYLTEKYWANIEIIDKKAIITISYSFSNDSEQYLVEVTTCGALYVSIPFKEAKEALSFKTELVKWKYNL